jgi:hypothetical protein
MKKVTLFPGTMEAIGQALDLFGEKRVFVGDWNEPICVNGLTAEEVTYARKFFGNIGCEVKEIT